GRDAAAVWAAAAHKKFRNPNNLRQPIAERLSSRQRGCRLWRPPRQQIKCFGSQDPDQLAGWHLATKGSALSGDHWRKISGALRLSLCMQGRQRSAAEREFRHDVA